MTVKKDFSIRQGETFQRIIRWETPPFVYKSISAITLAAPARVTAAGHGLTTGWRAVVVSSDGMEEINCLNSPPRTKDYHQVTVIDTNTIDFNDINSADYTAYTGGGYLQFMTPVDLTGYTAEMDIKDKIGGDVLFTLNTTNGMIVVDNANKVITINISATDTALFDWVRGVFDLEMYSPTGSVTTIYSGSILIVKEVTTA